MDLEVIKVKLSERTGNLRGTTSSEVGQEVEASFMTGPESGRGEQAFKEKTNKIHLNGTFFTSKIKKKTKNTITELFPNLR